MADLNIGKAPPNSAILPFYATGAIAFFVLCILMFLSAESFTGHYFSPHILTLVHLASLGWGTMIIFGAAHQLLPVICEQDLFSNTLASFSWYTLSSGVGLLAYSFWDFKTGFIMLTGGSLVVVSALLYTINVLLTTRVCKKYSIQKLFISSSSLWLFFTVCLGLLLAINLQYPFFKKNHLDILKLHAHAGLAGWFLQLITGVSTKLVPMFLLAKSDKENLLKYSFALQNAGLALFIVDGYFVGYWQRVFIYAALVLIGILCWLFYLFDAYKKRIRKKVELLMKHSFISFVCLVVAVVLLPLVYFSKGHNFTMLYGSLLFMGWITSIILGKTFKTLPFIVWNRHYKNLSGKVKVPLPKHLYFEELIKYQFWVFIAALVVFAIGLVAENLLIIKIGLILWIVVSSIYLINVIKVLSHKANTDIINKS